MRDTTTPFKGSSHALAVLGVIAPAATELGLLVYPEEGPARLCQRELSDA